VSDLELQDKRPRALWLLLPLVALLALVIGSFFGGSELLRQRAVRLLPADPACDLRAGPCSLAIPEGGSVRFAILPPDIPLLSPLQLQVAVQELEASEARVEIVGLGMDMGLNLTQLQATPDGGFSGQTVLPVCARSRMNWEARVLLRLPEGWVGFPFRFDTHK